MGHPQKKFDPTQDQSQAQANLQGQLQGQANLQGQLQGQGQGQGQGQSETQTAAQSLNSNSDNWNGNGNANGNLNGNGNFNANDNKNSNDNKIDNGVDNKLNNGVDNKVENTVDNKVETTVDTHVNVDVNLDISGHTPTAPVIDLHDLTTTDSLVMPEVVNQTLNGGGNMFHLDQVNNLVNNDTVTDPTVTFNGGGSSYDNPAGFSMDAKVFGGDSKISDATNGGVAGAGSGVISHADAALTQDAFTQTITTGANIQFNSNTMQVAGHDLTDDHHTL